MRFVWKPRSISLFLLAFVGIAASVRLTAQPGTEQPQPTPSTQAAGMESLGAKLIGKLEGPEVITDPTKFPATLKEAPQLAELVKSGALPPVADRIGQDPLVIKPVHEIGKYGGTWRRVFTGPGDVWNGLRCASGPDSILYYDYTGTKLVPNIAKGWTTSPDGRSTTLYLRRGMRWSDGEIFDADDFMFWYKDMYLNTDLNPTPVAIMMTNGKPGKLEKINQFTIKFSFADPYFTFPHMLAGSTAIASHTERGYNAMGGYAPAHYLKQFHPNYTSKEALDKKVADAKFDNWVNLFKARNSWAINPDLPVLSPWKTTVANNTGSWVLERNPYSIWIDTAGNQLPYIDKIVMSLASDIETVNLRAMAGEIDFQSRHLGLAKVPVFLENEQKGGYKLYLDPGDWGSDACVWINLSYEADPELGTWFRTTDFRRALSLGIRRDQINEAFFLGTGVSGSIVPADSNPANPGPKYRTLWSTYDPNSANAMLDKLGLNKKNTDGYRLRKDGKGVLRLELLVQTGQVIDYAQIAEMIREDWKTIGIQADVIAQDRNTTLTRCNANETQLFIWGNEGSDHMFTLSRAVFPSDPAAGAWGGILYAKWFASGGTQGKEPFPRMRELMDTWSKALGVPEDEQIKLQREVWKINADEVFVIGIVGLSAASGGVRIVKTNMGNVPSRQWNHGDGKTEANSRTMTFYWK